MSVSWSVKRIHVHVSPNMELKQIHTLTEMDTCTCTVPLYTCTHVHVDERIDIE